MIHIYFFFGVFAILWEMCIVYSPMRAHRFITTLRNDQKAGKKFDSQTSTQQAVSVCLLFYAVWTILGLITSQWLVFIFLLILAFIPKKYVAVRWVDSLLTLMLLLFAVINYYHLHIDLMANIKRYF